MTYGLDPLLNNENGDADYDGISNIDEYNAGTDPGTMQTDLILVNQTIPTSTTKEYRATNSIISGPAYIVETGADVSFKAGSVITLKPGFEASEGSIFHATIE